MKQFIAHNGGKVNTIRIAICISFNWRVPQKDFSLGFGWRYRAVLDHWSESNADVAVYGIELRIYSL